EFDGRPVAYLDSAATSQTPQVVIDAMTRYYTQTRASVHRGVYPLAVEATDQFEGARQTIASWLGSTAEETIFTANATAALTLVAYTWGRQRLGRAIWSCSRRWSITPTSSPGSCCAPRR